MLNSEVRLTFESTSGLKKRNVSRGLDIRTGVFTVEEGHGGIWSVSYSIKSQQHSGETNTAYLYLNDRRVEESHHFTSYYGQVYVESLGARTLYLRLEAGDSLTLRTGKLGWGLYDTLLCLHLLQPGQAS